MNNRPYILWITFALLIVGGVFVLLFATGCAPKTRVVYVPSPAPVEPCLKDPPKDLRPWSAVGGGEGLCHGSFDECLHESDAVALELNYRYLIRRVQDDWTFCGPKKRSTENVVQPP